MRKVKIYGLYVREVGVCLNLYVVYKIEVTLY